MLIEDRPVAPQRPPKRRVSRAAILLLSLAAFIGAGALLLDQLPSLNPFATETKDRSQPVLLKSLERLSEYRAASAQLQVIVDVEEDAEYLPSFILGEKTLLVAAGSVDAGVDFSGLDKNALRVSDNRRAVAITLPQPTLSKAELNLERTRVFDRDRGLLDRVGDAIGENPGGERSLLLLAEEKLQAAAAADSGLMSAARENTRAMLEGMMRGLGFRRVTVRFAAPQT
ncbi:MAG: DUF4230 domain-containing protein [Actinomycetota bacterium]|nr:DUF4230 domain-containing protein [Actinomycetota bacterium]